MSATATNPADTGSTNPAATCPYEKMTPEQLRAELERLDVVCVKQELQIKQLIEGTQNMLKDFSIPLFAHMNGDTDRVHAGLEAIVKKNVTFTGDLH